MTPGPQALKWGDPRVPGFCVHPNWDIRVCQQVFSELLLCAKHCCPSERDRGAPGACSSGEGGPDEVPSERGEYSEENTQDNGIEGVPEKASLAWGLVSCSLSDYRGEEGLG